MEKDKFLDQYEKRLASWSKARERIEQRLPDMTSGDGILHLVEALKIVCEEEQKAFDDFNRRESVVNRE